MQAVRLTRAVGGVVRAAALLLVAGTLLGPGPAGAQERLIAAPYPPLMIPDDARRPGYSVEIALEAGRRLGRRLELEFLPFNRALKTTQRRADALQASLFRLPSREPLYRWLARTHTEEMVFLTLDAPLDDLETARRLPMIGVETGSALDSFLTRQGFTNLERVDRPEINARKLLAGRIDAWALAKNSALWTWQGLGMNETLIAGAPLLVADVYVVSGPDFPDALAEAYGDVIEGMREDGTIARIIGSYFEG